MGKKMHHVHQPCRRDIPQRVPVGQGGGLCANSVDLIYGQRVPVQVQADGGHPHDAAASLALVDGMLYASLAGAAEGRQTGGSGRSAGKQLRLIYQPGAMRISRQGIALALGPVPVCVAEADIVGVGAADAPGHPPGGGQQKPRGREQSHLRVVRNLRCAVFQLIPGDALLPIAGKDCLLRKKLHRIAQCVSGCPAYQAASVFVKILHFVLHSVFNRFLSGCYSHHIIKRTSLQEQAADEKNLRRGVDREGKLYIISIGLENKLLLRR